MAIITIDTDKLNWCKMTGTQLGWVNEVDISNAIVSKPCEDTVLMTREEAHKILSNGLLNAPSEHEWCMAFGMAIEALEKEPFINKPCVAHQVCHEDKVKVLDKIRAEIEKYRDSMPWENKSIIQWEAINYILEKIIDKYKLESEEENVNIIDS